MSKFIQFHLLTSYPPANLNRDDLGRPKTAVMGGATRLRISSQSLKRSWRTSDVFRSSLGEYIGTRTKIKGTEVFEKLSKDGVSGANASQWASDIAGVFGKLKKLTKAETEEMKDPEKMKKPENRLKLEKKPFEIEQLAHFSPEEEQAIDSLIVILAEQNRAPTPAELELLRKSHQAADIAMFGRMLASSPKYNTEASVQVAHAISTHKVAIEDDFFTAVDDLNAGEDDMGAGHMGDTEFAAGLFYLYICIDYELLTNNLTGNIDLANKTVSALIESAATIAPSGKQNSFASRARASYILCEKGDQQPRSLSVSYIKPISAPDILTSSIKQLNETRANMDKVYGDCASQRCEMNANTGEGSLKEILTFATTV